MKRFSILRPLAGSCGQGYIMLIWECMVINKLKQFSAESLIAGEEELVHVVIPPGADWPGLGAHCVTRHSAGPPFRHPRPGHAILDFEASQS